jgi:hypothetical protein
MVERGGDEYVGGRLGVPPGKLDADQDREERRVAQALRTVGRGEEELIGQQDAGKPYCHIGVRMPQPDDEVAR